VQEAVLEVERLACSVSRRDGGQHALAIVGVQLREKPLGRPLLGLESGQALDRRAHIDIEHALLESFPVRHEWTNKHDTGELLDQRAVAQLGFAQLLEELALFGHIDRDEKEIPWSAALVADECYFLAQPHPATVLVPEAILQWLLWSYPIPPLGFSEYPFAVFGVNVAHPDTELAPLFRGIPREIDDAWADEQCPPAERPIR
jgi:hypothetical protein